MWTTRCQMMRRSAGRSTPWRPTSDCAIGDRARSCPCPGISYCCRADTAVTLHSMTKDASLISTTISAAYFPTATLQQFCCVRCCAHLSTTFMKSGNRKDLHATSQSEFFYSELQLMYNIRIGPVPFYTGLSAYCLLSLATQILCTSCWSTVNAAR